MFDRIRATARWLVTPYPQPVRKTVAEMKVGRGADRASRQQTRAQLRSEATETWQQPNTCGCQGDTARHDFHLVSGALSREACAHAAPPLQPPETDREADTEAGQ